MEKLLTLALSLLMIMSVCLTGAIAEEGSVVIENNGRTTTYNSVPERVVVLSYRECCACNGSPVFFDLQRND